MMLRRDYKPVEFTGWRNHVGDMVVCRYTDTSGLHIGKILSQGVYHAYRVPGTNSGDTVITAFNMFRFKDLRFYRRKS